MKILVADDDELYRRLLERLLGGWGYGVVAATDGEEALAALAGEGAPSLAILDWMMPRLDGVEVCRRARASHDRPLYLILLTSRAEQDDIVAGLQAGADDFLTKPIQAAELRARVEVGRRVVGLQSTLVQRVEELQEALSHIKTLRGLLPICSYCKKIRDDKNYWQQVESYVASHSDAQFSHGICPECYRKHVEPQLAELRRKRQAEKEPPP